MNVTIVLSWFDKKTEEFSGKEILRSLNEEDFKKIVKSEGSSANFDYTGEYPVEDEILLKLKTYIHFCFNFDKYDYFIGYRN